MKNDKAKKRPKPIDPYRSLTDEEFHKVTGIWRRDVVYLAQDFGVPYDAEQDIEPLPEDENQTKVLGRPIGASDEIVDGDGDGKYTAAPGAGDSTPVPLQLFDADQFIDLREKPDWDLEDIIDFEAAGWGPPSYQNERLYELHDETISAWGYWNPCREIRQAAYLLTGQKNLSNADPHIGRSGSLDSGAKGLRVEGARYLLGALAQDARFPQQRPLYRAVSLTKEEKERFWESVKEGQDIAIPLLATANEHQLAGEDILGGVFGKDVLLEIVPGNVGVTAGSFSPFYNSDDEEETLDRMDEAVEYWATKYMDELKTQIESTDDDLEKAMIEGERDDLIQRIQEGKESLREYRKTLTKLDELLKSKELQQQKYQQLLEKRDKLRKKLVYLFAEHIEDGEDIIRWHGDVIDESDSTRFYDEVDRQPEETSLYEIITGGRFNVESIDDDPRGVFGKIVRLRQLAVFDPQKPGSMIQVAGAPTPKGKVKVLWL